MTAATDSRPGQGAMSSSTWPRGAATAVSPAVAGQVGQGLAAQGDDPCRVVEGEGARRAGPRRSRPASVRPPRRGPRRGSATAGPGTPSSRTARAGSRCPRAPPPVPVPGRSAARSGDQSCQGRRARSQASIDRAKTSDSAYNCRPMPCHWEPWPGNTKTTGPAAAPRPCRAPPVPPCRRSPAVRDRPASRRGRRSAGPPGGRTGVRVDTREWGGVGGRRCRVACHEVPQPCGLLAQGPARTARTAPRAALRRHA